MVNAKDSVIDFNNFHEIISQLVENQNKINLLFSQQNE